MPTRTLTKMSKLCFRFSENQKMKVRRPPKNHQKSMKKRLRKHVGKKSAKLLQNDQLGVQLGTQEVRRFWDFRLLGPSMFRFCIFVVFNSLLGASWDHLGTNSGPFWDHFGTILSHIWTNVFFNFFVLFVFTSLTSLTAFIQGLADCAQRFK